MINVIGLGYIGLPTALMFAKNGIKVVGTDINKDLIYDLNNGIIPIDEPGINEVFEEAIKNKIKFTTEYQRTNTYIVTVPTPYDENTKKINVEYVLSAMYSILEVCDENTVIIIESTISPGTTEKHLYPLIEHAKLTQRKNIHLVHAPERIIPGNMIYELENNSRTIGVDDENVAQQVKELYSSFCKSEIILTDVKTAEMSKVVENTFRDINIAFANELAKLCNAAGLDVYEIIRIANKHPRVNILQPGPGVGGHCIPVDPWFLVGDYPEHTELIKNAREVNSGMPKYVLDRLSEIMLENNIKDFSKVGIYGLTYKENIADTRNSPGIQIIEALVQREISDFWVYDPYLKENNYKNQFTDLDSFLNEINLLVIIVAHSEIRTQSLDGLVIFDTTNSIKKDNVYKL